MIGWCSLSWFNTIAPLTVSVTQNGPGSVIVLLSPPSDLRSTSIATYTVTASLSGASSTVTSPATSCTIHDLGAGSFTFSVSASNLAGTGPIGFGLLMLSRRRSSQA